MKSRVFHRGTPRRTARHVTDRGAGDLFARARGLRIEDVVLVTPQGAEVLYAMRKQCCSRERHNGFIVIKSVDEADAIASSEQEVRQILLEEGIACKKKCDLTAWDRC